jgi:hypothetical protein
MLKANATKVVASNQCAFDSNDITEPFEKSNTHVTIKLRQTPNASESI